MAFSISGLAIFVALTIGLTEAVKRIGLNKRYLPLAAVVIGIVLAFLGRAIVGADASWGMIILIGIATGLQSVGLFSGLKNSFVVKK